MRLGFKIPLIGFTMLVLLVPILLLNGLVYERQQRAAEVRAEVAQSSSRAQRITGPLLRIEVERAVPERRLVMEEGVQREVVETKTVREARLLLPARLGYEAGFTSERRGRSLFLALLYHLKLKAGAEFDTTGLLAEGERAIRADLLLGLGDNRGIRSLGLSVGGKPLSVEPGARLPWLEAGVQASLPLAELQAQQLSVQLDAEISGTEALDFVPVGADTEVRLGGDWPHPSFGGDLLPQAPELRADGFSAQWKVSRLASQAQQAVRQCGLEATHCAGLSAHAFGLRLVDPVDRYLMTERAMKYALLVLVLVFGAVFFVEVVGGDELHPLHYGLIGLALAMFFLLLLALSEHIGFGLAYLLAALACIALIAVYLAGVLESRAKGWASAGLLAGLYALLYALLKAEDYALLGGALVLFGCLAVFMLATRRVRWAALGRAGTQQP
ncbi:cell envelope integrity protein CreD [uncultured Aquimonas sp.]|uniref:cell envelope integrity protein CreD n=1 Tax=uncultured Aquimonas sp. TaxID=385483 RepID=UPI00086D5ECE|nr:cell envelope integrity protein CreD [uncultured Aquimonas sp.]ODU45239.1 MAG: hypothetical protein ABS96_14320 [Xanthomonadaceae bacterium SCN 69-123]